MTTTAITVPDAMATTIQAVEAQLVSLADRASKIIVTSCDQLTEMKQAELLRKEAKGIRCEIERCRKDYGEPAFRRYKEVNAFANAVKAKIEPIEDAMEQAATFAIRAEAARKAALAQERAEALGMFGVDSSCFNLGEMPQATFDGILEKAQEDDRKAKEAARLAEEERKAAVAKAKAESDAKEAERKRLAAENRRLVEEQCRLDAEAREEMLKAKQKQREMNAKAEAALAAERKAREAAEAEAKRIRAEAIASAERERQELLDAERKVREEREKAARAPDKAKAKALADALVAFPVPDFTSVPGKAIHARVCQALGELAEEIDEMATHL